MAGITDWTRVETRHDLEGLINQHLALYQDRMTRYLGESVVPPPSLELRAKHALLKMKAVDSFRNNSVGRPIGVWKLERELDLAFEDILLMTRRVRRESFTDQVKYPRITSLVI